jgi:hypothetical protein
MASRLPTEFKTGTPESLFSERLVLNKLIWCQKVKTINWYNRQSTLMDLIETSRHSNAGSAALLRCSEGSRMFARWWCILLPISSVLGINQTRPHIIFILADDLVSTHFCTLRCVTWQNIHMGTAWLILEDCLATCCLRNTKLLTTLTRCRGTCMPNSL